MKNLATWMLLLLSSEIIGQDILKATLQTSPFQKIDMMVIKNQSYLKLLRNINCDSTSGTTIEDRICANLELQRQDSLLQVELSALLGEKAQDTAVITKILNSQEIWERFRCAYCSNFVDYSRIEMIQFMQFASELTLKRRKDIRNILRH